jgi:hypothetical protein
MIDRLILSDARKYSGAAFLDAVAPLFGKPAKADQQKQVELAQALADHEAAIQQTYRSGAKLWDQIIARDALKAEYAARVQEVEQRYAEGLTEVRGDPLLVLDDPYETDWEAVGRRIALEGMDLPDGAYFGMADEFGVDP